MQTWAKRGVQAALVTGGMLAVGTGVASAGQTCPDRPTPPLGESVLPPALDEFGDDAAPTDRCLEGAETQYNAPVVETRGSHHAVTALTGKLDPVHDLLPAVENELTQEMPALRDAGWIQPSQSMPLHLAGWIADPADARPLDIVSGLPPFDGDRPVTPAEGFHRSLSWAGPIGEVIQGGADTLDEGTFRAGQVMDVPADLVIPHDDLVYFDGFGAANGIVELWENALSQSSGGLVTPDQLDLTSADLPGMRSSLHTVPPELVGVALSAAPAKPAPRPEFVPLTIPGENQLQANEIPVLDALPPLGGAPNTAARSESPGIEAPLPGLGKLSAVGGGDTSIPAVSKITDALNPGSPAPAPRHAVAPRTGVPGGLPDFTAVQGQTLPLPALTPDRLLRSVENADTQVLGRVV